MDLTATLRVFDAYLESYGTNIVRLTIAVVLLVCVVRRVVFGIACASIAKSKGYRHGFWWGFLLPLLGLLVVALRPQKVVTVRMGPTYPLSAE